MMAVGLDLTQPAASGCETVKLAKVLHFYYHLATQNIRQATQNQSYRNASAIAILYRYYTNEACMTYRGGLVTFSLPHTTVIELPPHLHVTCDVKGQG